MKDKKNAPTGAATSAGARGTGAASRQATTSNDHDTTPTPPGQGLHIADLLSRGADHGVHLSDLVRLTDLPERTVRLTIRAERLSGVPILENSRSGYFLPNDDDERMRCAQRLKRRAHEILRTARAIERAR